MKTIGMTIDEPTLERIDRLMSSNSVPWKSRSEVIRHAVQQFVARLERATEKEPEAAALIKEQAKP